MHVADGSRSNLFPICFGKGGLRSICHNYRNARSGIVLIVDDSAPRNSWVIGRVTEAVSDRIGLVQQVKIKTQTSTLSRPVTKICLLQESAQSV